MARRREVVFYAWIAAMEGLSGAEQRLLSGLMMAMGEGNKIEVGQGKIALAMGMEAATASRAMKGLKGAGIVRVAGKELRLDPNVAWCGRAAGRAEALAKWEARK